MSDDYGSAAARHYLDAKALKDSGQSDNAGHLIGFAAECAIKFRIQSLQPGANSPQLHLPDLLVAARKKFGARGQNVSMLQIVKDDHFSTWNVNRRYWITGSTDATELDDWFKVARRLLGAAQIKVA